MSQQDFFIEGNVAFLPQSETAIYFSKSPNSAGASKTSNSNKGTAAIVKDAQTSLKVAYWGEDNRFPQNIEQQMAFCGVGKNALDWKARILYGNGIVPGKITGFDTAKNVDIFEPLDRKLYKPVYDFIGNRNFYRFFLEYAQDWAWFNNCFPELILSNDAKTITGFVHQESCDCRYKQMDEDGVIDTVYLSKLWGAPKSQYALFDAKKSPLGLPPDTKVVNEVDYKFVKPIDCIDMYNSLDSLTKIAEKKKDSKGFKSAILPVNYPSPNKTYYQVPAWDGARLAGWVEIISKIPNIIKTLYEKSLRIKTHIEIPETYFEEKYGIEEWNKKLQPEKLEAKKALLAEMRKFLSGEENAYSTFINFFKVDDVNKTDYGHVVITSIKDELGLDKDLLVTSAGSLELLAAMGIHPSLVNGGMPGNNYRSGGGSGSDIREAFLVYLATINLEREILLEPLYLARDFNREVGGIKEWEEDIVFKFKDIVLTTLDTGGGTAKKLS